jgi:hypothetical protein
MVHIPFQRSNNKWIVAAKVIGVPLISWSNKDV